MPWNPESEPPPLKSSAEERVRIWIEKFVSYDENRIAVLSRDACRNGLLAWATKHDVAVSHQMLDEMMAEIEAAMKAQV